MAVRNLVTPIWTHEILACLLRFFSHFLGLKISFFWPFSGQKLVKFWLFSGFDVKFHKKNIKIWGEREKSNWLGWRIIIFFPMTTFDNVLLDSGLGLGLSNIIHQSNRGMLPCSIIHTPLQLHANVKTVCSNVVACNWTN